MLTNLLHLHSQMAFVFEYLFLYEGKNHLYQIPKKKTKQNVHIQLR